MFSDIYFFLKFDKKSAKNLSPFFTIVVNLFHKIHFKNLPNYFWESIQMTRDPLRPKRKVPLHVVLFNLDYFYPPTHLVLLGMGIIPKSTDPTL